jgi:cation transport ATPase
LGGYLHAARGDRQFAHEAVRDRHADAGAAGGRPRWAAWAEGALLLFLFSIGHALEHYAMGRAKRAIEALAELRPTALVRRDGQTREIPSRSLRSATS